MDSTGPVGGSPRPSDGPVLVSGSHGDGLEHPDRAPGTGELTRMVPARVHRVQIWIYDNRESYRWECDCGAGGSGSRGGFYDAELYSDIHLDGRTGGRP